MSNRIKSSSVESESLNFINFNQDGSCISIGTSKGYKIFNSSPFGKCYSRFDQGGIGIIEMLFQTSLIVISGIGDQPSMSPRRLKILNTKKNSTICELTFPTTILSIKLNKSRLVILLEEQIYIYDINNMRLLHTIETSSNVNGLCALSPTIDQNYLVYPSPPRTTNLLNSSNHHISSNLNNHNSSNLNSNHIGHNSNSNTNNNNNNSNNNNINDNDPHSNHNTNNTPSHTQNNDTKREGDVIVFNAQILQPSVVIEAHKSPIAALTISYDGTLLATASDKGTIIRVFSIETGNKIYQFRRGTYPTKIHSLSFSRDNKYLTASSSTETVHIFKLGDNNSISSNGSNEELNDDLLDLPKPSINRSESFGSENSQQRRVSNSSFESINSNELENINEPLVDISRRTVGRMIRKSSQNIGRKAAERIGSFLPPRLTSMLEPNRHFASLKIPAQNGVKNVVSIGKEIKMSKSGLSFYSNSPSSNDETTNDEISDENNVKLVHVLVVSSEGYFYNYGLDPERGGDCILLNQYSLTDI
ncbi:hypothetical protein WICMUC_004566 [Wickerhamomyces mucosus]|uniref:Autophagy-related protein 18 n=1 Tax=Wickerhamomyces mucosus TaxID=1378264 RepID=A0A9P8PHL1_9ASCO|nr:hypothetical protein WICMUC_004566 [Wickerhamomyces mucosus]